MWGEKLKIEHDDLKLPFSIKDTIYYIDDSLKKVIELEIRGFQIYLNAILLDCLIKDIAIRHKLRTAQISFNLLLEQNIFTDLKEANKHLKSICS